MSVLHLIRSRDRQASEQVRINFVTRSRLAQVPLRIHGHEPHLPEQPPNPLGIDDAHNVEDDRAEQVEKRDNDSDGAPTQIGQVRRLDAKEATVVPLLVRRCDWKAFVMAYSWAKRCTPVGSPGGNGSEGGVAAPVIRRARS